jgi:prepilin-type N-terminal cleavage/methylation domain-containing protein
MRGPDSGFTLVETLASLVIFAAALLALYQSFSGGWRGYRRAEAEAAAVSFAQSRLAAAGVEAPLVEGQQYHQSEDGLAWITDVRRYGQPSEEKSQAPRSTPQVFWVTVEVSWRDGALPTTHKVSLTTLKLHVAR